MTPQFTIFLPVRNGGAYLRDCIASINAQSYTDFEVVVLENGSTDGTAEWLQRLHDTRLTVLPSDRPLTIEENWDRIRSLPAREFMTIVAHDDLLDPDYLQTVSELIALHPNATLYQTHFRFIGDNSEPLRRCRPMPRTLSTAELSPRGSHPFWIALRAAT